jgi:hypothetical protein
MKKGALILGNEMKLYTDGGKISLGIKAWSYTILIVNGGGRGIVKENGKRQDEREGEIWVFF